MVVLFEMILRIHIVDHRQIQYYYYYYFFLYELLKCHSIFCLIFYMYALYIMCYTVTYLFAMFFENTQHLNTQCRKQ